MVVLGGGLPERLEELGPVLVDLQGLEGLGADVEGEGQVRPVGDRR